jgi:hypothetical protein
MDDQVGRKMPVSLQILAERQPRTIGQFELRARVLGNLVCVEPSYRANPRGFKKAPMLILEEGIEGFIGPRISP